MAAKEAASTIPKKKRNTQNPNSKTEKQNWKQIVYLTDTTF